MVMSGLSALIAASGLVWAASPEEGSKEATTTTTKSRSSTGTSSKAKAKSKSGSGSSTTAKSKSGSTSSKAKAKAQPKSDSDDVAAKSKEGAKVKAAPTVADEGEDVVAKGPPRPAMVSSINVDELAGFDSYPKQVRSLVESAVALTHLDLTYTFGSSEPNRGGMDCSGTIYHVLRFQGLKDVPRQSDEMCGWVRDRSNLHLTPTAEGFDSPEFDALKPGDLLFWTGTMQTTRKLPVTHVMLYVGRLKSNGKRVVFGSSDGRSYEGQRRCGVSIFDFHLPKPGGKAAFYGYGPAPGLPGSEEKDSEEIRKAVLPAPIAAAGSGKKEGMPTAAAGSIAEKAPEKPAASVASVTPASAPDKPSASVPPPVAPAAGSPLKRTSKDAPPAAGSETIGTKPPAVAKADPPAPEKSKSTGARAASTSEPGEPESPESAVAKNSTAEDKAAPARKTASTTRGRSSEEPARTKSSGTVAKSTGTVTTAAKKPVAQRSQPSSTQRKRPVQSNNDVDPGKVVKRVVDAVRGAFQ